MVSFSPILILNSNYNIIYSEKNSQIVDLNASDVPFNNSNSTVERDVYEDNSNSFEDDSFNIEVLNDNVLETNNEESVEKSIPSATSAK